MVSIEKNGIFFATAASGNYVQTGNYPDRVWSLAEKKISADCPNHTKGATVQPGFGAFSLGFKSDWKAAIHSP